MSDENITASPETFGYSWCSDEPEPDEWPDDLNEAVGSAFKALVNMIWDVHQNPIDYWSFADTLPQNPNSDDGAYFMAKMLSQILKGANLGSRLDKNKSKEMPFPKLRRSFYVFNLFTMHGGLKPGFIWWSDMDSARWLALLLGRPVDADDVKNDRRYFNISKMPAKYLVTLESDCFAKIEYHAVRERVDDQGV